jgi:ADP-ribose pyrophosphatase YjhB (NUDIX family)
MSQEVPTWLQLAREIQSLSQTGLHFSQTDYDRHRYGRLLEIAAEMVALKSFVEAEAAARNFRLQSGYATPKVDVRGAVVREGRILLVRERSDGLWCLPGGWADVGETPSEMVVREVREESGCDVIPLRVVGVYDANRGGEPLEFYHAYKIVFLCELTGGEATAGEETLAAEFFARDSVPPLSLQRTGPRHLNDVWACFDDPFRATLFD